MKKLSDYDYFLPKDLLAKEAILDRAGSRLMRLSKEDVAPRHDNFRNIGSYLNPGDVLVVNNTKVMKARIEAFKTTGGRVLILLVRPINNRFHVLIDGRGPFLTGTKLHLGCTGSANELRVIDKVKDEPGLYEVEANLDLAHYADLYGKLPLPPYFGREAEARDYESYQTVFAKDEHWGAVAAPTAGLHFSNELLNTLKAQGVRIVETTLHVGPGTFLPIRVENLDDHRMHSEWFSLNADSAEILNHAKTNNHRIIAVGTTALRVLEQTMQWAYEKNSQDFFACRGITSLFIRPGFKFLAADGLITNFHLPRSTLLVLVAAVVGLKRVLQCYEEAIKEHYHFYSYGDACFFDMADL